MNTSGKPRARRARPLKVYAIDLFVRGHGEPDDSQQCRVIVATHSKAEAAVLVDSTMYYFGAWGSETGNDAEIELAMGTPGALFSKPLNEPSDAYRTTKLDRHILRVSEVEHG